MKKLIALALAALAVGFVRADEEINMEEKEIQTVSIPFGIRSYTPSNKDVVRIEKVSDTSLRLTALKQGRCDIEVRGDLEMTQKFQILVGSPITRKLSSLQRRLERIPEVHAQVIDDKIDINGEIKSIEKWNLLMKVLEGYPKDLVNNFAKFIPGEELMMRIKDSLQQCGFEVVFGQKFEGDWNTWKGNCVAISDNRNIRTLLIQAKVFTPEQAKMIEECFKSEKFWLKIDQDDKKTFDDEKQYKGRMMVYVAKPQIRLSVAYMAVGLSDFDQIGNHAAATGDALYLGGVFEKVRDLVAGATTRRTAEVGGGINAVANFLAKNGVSKISNIGYTQIQSWDKDGAKFKSGGTRFIKVFGRDVAELKEVPYGFTIDAKGGMVDPETMDVNFDFGLSSILHMDDDTYDRKEDLSKQRIKLTLGRTTMVSGFADLVDRHTGPEGIPFFRHTPILNWFVSETMNEVTDRKLVIMICPEIVDPTKDGTIDVKGQIEKPLDYYKDKTSSEIEDERNEKFTGFWSWLNWFTF